jgi:hypothetical protein
MKKFFVTLLLCTTMAVFIAILTMATSATADIIYTNIGDSGNNFALYPTPTGVNISGHTTTSPSYQAVAVAFTASANYTLSQLTIPLMKAQIGSTIYPAGARVDLVENNAGKPTGTVLETWTITDLPLAAAAWPPQTFTSTGSTQLLAGSSYWVAIFPTTVGSWPYTRDLWLVNTLGNTPNSGYNFSLNNNSSNSTGWYGISGTSSTPGLKIEGTLSPVPIPPNVWLFGSGLIGLIGLRRKFASYLKK